MGLGSAMAGGNATNGRQDDDFYPTPGNVTQALLTVETFPGPVLEPACGDGSMVRELEAAGYRVIASDINPRGVGKTIDFLGLKGRLAANVSIVTNPPFTLAVSFIEKAMELGASKLCLVLKSTFWHAANRNPLWRRHQPARIYPLLWRPDFLGLGRPTMEVAWHVWDCEHVGATVYQPLLRP